MEKNTRKLYEIDLEKEKDKKIINAILNNSNAFLTDIFEEYRKNIKPLVLSFRNSILEPDDIFQEGVYYLIRNVKRGDFKGESSVYGYFYGICRNKCNELLLKNSSKRKISSLKKYIEADQVLGIIEEEEKQIMREHILLIKNKLNEECREIIDLRFKFNQMEVEVQRKNKNLSFEEIGKMINKSADTSKHYFLRCIKKLRELIDLDPELKDYYR